MTTGILVGLTIVLILAAAWVGLLLLRRRRPRPAAPPVAEAPQTVGELVKQRTGPADERSGNDLFTPSAPRTGPTGIPLTARPGDGPRPAPLAGAEARTLQVPVPQQEPTPPTGEAGDAPWRRAARMMGAEPGAGWDTAPLPVMSEAPGPEPHRSESARRPDAQRTVEIPVPPALAAAAQPAPAAGPPASGRSVATDSPATDSPATEEPVDRSADVPGVASAVGEPAAVQPGAPTPAEAAVSEPARTGPAETGPAETGPPARPAPAERVTEPVALPVVVPPGPAAPAAERPRPTPTRRTGAAAAEVPSVWTLPEAVDATSDKPTTPLDRSGLDRSGLDRSGLNGTGPNGSSPAPAGSDGPSRPLSDPDLTPLMGIPIVRPHAADEPVPPPAVAEPRATPSVPPTNRVFVDDEVVSMSPATGVRPAPVVRTGSPQPVWFRVVRRDGEPVAGAVVALLDDHGQEVDATKTATDGGGELHSPHGGRFLMVTSAEGFQPRAVLLTVDGQPVELALLLPRSAAVSGAVRSGERLVTGARVIARQEGEIVDDLVTGRDGSYRFDDLPEGSYVLSATDHRGSVVQQVRLSEGADLPFDLELVYRDGAR